MMLSLLLAAAIELTGVTAGDLRVRAYFDANNVKVGDPMVLTVDFIGEADFAALHPPRLARHLDRSFWKLDDASARTDTNPSGRSLTYRVRPMREGVLYFPSLSFAYLTAAGERREIISNPLPVHAKKGVDVVVAEMAEDPNAMPEPPSLILAAPVEFGEDEAFAWRRACAKPSADSFSAFDGPQARLNEATMAIREGNWSRALSIYRLLEWRTGQTPAIEQGIIAALALRYDNPHVELPVWRQVLRPILRFNGFLRAAILLGAFLSAALLFWLLGRGLRAVACLALVCAFAASAWAETVETVTTNADGSVTRTIRRTSGNGSFSFSTSTTTGGSGQRPSRLPSMFASDPFEMFESMSPFGGPSRRARPPADIRAKLIAESSRVTVGETFRLVLEVERPHYIAFTDALNLSLGEMRFLQQVGPGEREMAKPAKNPTNVIDRLIFRLRANAPFTNLTYSVKGDYLYAGESSFFARPKTFEKKGKSVLFVRPLPKEGQPADFSGIVAEKLTFGEVCDSLNVESNDVITITYRLRTEGFVPADFLPKDAAFEWTRQREPGGAERIEYRRYFVADGASTTPPERFSYYNPVAGAYRSVETSGKRIIYKGGNGDGQTH